MVLLFDNLNGERVVVTTSLSRDGIELVAKSLGYASLDELLLCRPVRFESELYTAIVAVDESIDVATVKNHKLLVL